MALKYYERALEINPNHTVSLANSGMLLNAMGYSKKAKINLRRAIDLDPNYAVAHYNLGVTYKSMGEHQKALGNYEQALKLYQNLADNNELFLPYVAATNNSLSILYAELKNYDKELSQMIRFYF